MMPTSDIDKLHVTERMAYHLRARCNKWSSDREKLIALANEGFRSEDILDYWAEANKLAWR